MTGLRSGGRKSRLAFGASFLALGAALGASPAGAATFTVTTAADGVGAGTLRWAINEANASGGADTIVFDAGLAGDVTIDIGIGDLPALVEDVTIDMGGKTLDANGNRGFFAYSGTIVIENGTIANAVAQGGNGGYAGGGAGMGGALFVAENADVTVRSVVFSDNSASGGGPTGGGVGGGGMGGDGGTSNAGAGGGGIGSQADGAVGLDEGNPGIVTGAASGGGFETNVGGASGGGGAGGMIGGSSGGGGGGGIGGQPGVAGPAGSEHGGDGGFGGGGGGAGLNDGDGGDGGFGGGGGSGRYYGQGGDGGYGGGSGYSSGGVDAGDRGFGGGGSGSGVTGGQGGGGAGMGGAVFVMEGGSLTIEGTTSMSGSTVVAGNSLNGGDGSAFGSAIYLHGSGTLGIGDITGTQTITGDIVDETGVIANGYAWAGDVEPGRAAGAWGLTVDAGAGTLALTGANAYSGGTSIDSGTVAVDSAAGLGSGTVTFGGGRLLATDTLTLNNDVVFASGQTGTIAAADGETLTVAGDIDRTFDTDVRFGSAGGGAGTVVLAQSSTTSAGGTDRTFIDNGTVRAGNAIGGSFFLTGVSGTHINDGATLDANGFDLAVSALQDGADGGGTITNSGATQVGLLLRNNAASEFSGVIEDGVGGFSVTKTNSGTLTLSGANTYSGYTAVSGGTLRAGAENAFSSRSAMSLSAGTTLDLNGFDQTVASLAGSGAVTLGSATLTAGGNNASTTYSGAMSGTGGLTKVGTGTLSLTGGNNTFEGGLAINGGTLAFEDEEDLGAVAGGISIDGGTLQDTRTFFDVVNHGVTVGAGGATFIGEALNLGGDIGGTGGVAIGGASARVLFAGTNTYAGDTHVDEGILVLNNGDAIPDTSRVTVATGATLLFQQAETIGSLAGGGQVSSDVSYFPTALTIGADGTDATFSGVIHDDDPDVITQIVKTGSGTQIFSGINTYSGSTTVNQGVLEIASGGSIVGSSTVNGGSFVVNGTAGSVNVLGGFLGGTGTVGATTIGNGGTFAPGNSIGTTTVIGPLDLAAGSTYQVEVDAAGNSDLIDVTGTVTLGGGTLSVLAAGGGSYGPNTDYIIIANDGADAVTGTFGTVTSDLAFLTPTVNYAGGTGNDVALNLTRNGTSFGAVAGTFNQTQAGTGLAALDQTPGSDSLTVHNTILGLTAGQARAAYDSASGEIHASAQHMGAAMHDLYRQLLNEQARTGVAGPSGDEALPLAYRQQPQTAPAALALNYADAQDRRAADRADERVKAAWAAPLGGAGRVAGDGNAAALDWWTTGLAGGYQGSGFAGSGRFVAGMSAGYLRGGGSVAARNSNVTSDSLNLGGYGAWTNGSWTLSGSAAWSAANLNTSRTVAIGGITRTAAASYWTHSLGFSAEAARNFDLGSFTLSPLVSIDAGWTGHGGAMETGAGALNLALAPESRFWLDTGLGVALERRFVSASGRTVKLDARAVGEHSFGSTTPDQALSFSGSPAGFTVRGPAAGRDRLRVGLGLGFQTSASTSIRASYDGSFLGGQQSHTANASLKVRF